jgi:K+-sensing histidine kinase KdpD
MEELDLNSHLASNFLSDLLDFAQIENDKFRLNIDFASLDKLLHKAPVVLKRKIQNKDIEIRIAQETPE